MSQLVLVVVVNVKTVAALLAVRPVLVIGHGDGLVGTVVVLLYISCATTLTCAHFLPSLK